MDYYSSLNRKIVCYKLDKTRHYFPLEKGTLQGELIAVYLFILILEIAFLFIKANKSGERLTIFNYIQPTLMIQPFSQITKNL